ncbi:MAG: FG-GAP-like repeat-containing protein [Phycisphaerales bacterium]
MTRSSVRRRRRALLLGGTSALTIASGVLAQQFQQQTTTRFPVQAEYTNQATFGDLDGDGDLDIVFANGQGYSSLGALLKPRIYINDGTGVFADETDARAAGVTGCFRGVELGDCDRDGDLDMVLAQDFFRKPKLLLNDGTGVFTDASDRLPDANLSSARAQFGDIDDDGDLDLVFNHSGTGSRFGSNGAPRLYLNDGTGHYSDASAERIPTAIIPDQQDILFFDMDLDLDLDLHVATRSSSNGGSQIWRNEGGVFVRISGVPTDFSTYSYDAGDCDGDGDLDLIGANADSSNREMLLRNFNGDGSIWQKISSQITPNPSVDDNDTKFLDLDNDGDLDLIVAVLGGARERVYVNSGNCTFVENTSLISSQSDSSLDVMVGDLTGDGRLDIVTAQGESGNFQNRIYVNVNGPVDTLSPRVLAMDEAAPAKGDLPGPQRVRALVVDDMTSDRGFFALKMELRFTVGGGKEQSVDMAWVGNSLWRGVLPEFPPCSEVVYWVIAEDLAGNAGQSKAVAYVSPGECGGNPADLDGDGSVGGADLAIVLAAWGSKGGPADLDGDGTVGGADLAMVLAAWGG